MGKNFLRQLVLRVRFFAVHCIGRFHVVRTSNLLLILSPRGRSFLPGMGRLFSRRRRARRMYYAAYYRLVNIHNAAAAANWPAIECCETYYARIFLCPGGAFSFRCFLHYVLGAGGDGDGATRPHTPTGLKQKKTGLAGGADWRNQVEPAHRIKTSFYLVLSGGAGLKSRP